MVVLLIVIIMMCRVLILSGMLGLRLALGVFVLVSLSMWCVAVIG